MALASFLIETSLISVSVLVTGVTGPIRIDLVLLGGNPDLIPIGIKLRKVQSFTNQRWYNINLDGSGTYLQ